MTPLHVTNGTTVVSLIREAGLPGDACVWADALHDGPVPAIADDEALIGVRARHLARELARLGEAFSHGQDLEGQVAQDLRSARAEITAASPDEIVLWYEHDLFDQLNLIQVLSWLREHSSAPVRLVRVDAFVARPGFKGIGELAPTDVAELFDARVPVTTAQSDEAWRAWDAFRAPAPTMLDALRNDVVALPWLGPALTRLLQEYPATSDGLSRSERRLLALAADGPATLGQLFPRMHQGETAYYVTDLSLLAMADTLSRPTAGLITSTGESSLTRRVSLTDRGRAVLAGEARADERGYDRWFGGVHVTIPGNPWWWDETQGRVVRER